MGKARLDRRGLLAGIGASMALGPHAQASARGLTFLALGDWGQRGAPVQRRVAQAMGVVAGAEACDFVVSAGDNFYPAGVASTSDPHWRSSFEDVYTAPALQAPWFAALGNHDYRGSVKAQVAYSRLSRRWRMPDCYFTVLGEDFGAPFVDLFVIDTSPMVDERNYDELVQQLAHGHHASAGLVRNPWRPSLLFAARRRLHRNRAAEIPLRSGAGDSYRRRLLSPNLPPPSCR